ncbi:MAG TPA: hypothetical protein VFZ31_06015 [Vicinamibacterales bacterium]
MVLTGLVFLGCGPARPAPIADGVFRTAFDSSENVEAIARLKVRCERCAWDTAGSEAVVLKLTLDDRAPIHVPIVRSGEADYDVMLGLVGAGKHSLAISEDAELTAKALTGANAAQWTVSIDQIEPDADSFEALSLAPFVHARPNTVGKFTDVPILMWYEVEKAPAGRRYRYTVIFTNEDGGTPVDRLMATWGRSTDIEYVYSVELGAGGSIVSEDMQGPEHEILPFAGKREGRHPLLWVSTDNNMVLDRGTTTVRYAPAPLLVNLTDVSREMVMDTNAWTYAVASKELTREAKIADDPPPGKGTIPDPRRYAYLEGCGTLGNRALTFSIKVNDKWIAADRGVAEYRIARDGCFRGAVPLPVGATVDNVTAVRVHAYPRKDRPATTPVIFTRLNTLFGLDDRYRPTAGRLHWTGNAQIRPGTPLEIPIP